jgi:SAM-dependent methyltransferase
MALAQAADMPGRHHLEVAGDFIALINGGAMAKAVCVAAELKIADLLAGGAKSVEELARATQSHAPSLHRLMRALASLDLCAEGDDGAFALRPMGTLLLSNAPQSLRSWTIWTSGYMWSTWGNLLYSVRSGKSVRKQRTGLDGFAHLDRDEEAAAVFNGAMAEMTGLVAGEVVRACDLSGARQIVDVGGGYGTLLGALLEAYPDAFGTLLDRPHAIAGARAQLATAGLSNRCKLVAGDFFEAVPAGADIYVLKAILHDWDDERSTVILRNCRRAMAPDGKLLLIEQVLPDRFEASARHHALARSDLNMLIALGGRERTEAEFDVLLQSAAFRLSKVAATGLEYSLLEGVPV